LDATATEHHTDAVEIVCRRAYACSMLAVAEVASRVGRVLDTVRSWLREGPVRAIQDELHPMAELPDEWKTGDDGSPASNWVAALHRSRTGR
jgi:hypothetical protein